MKRLFAIILTISSLAISAAITDARVRDGDSVNKQVVQIEYLEAVASARDFIILDAKIESDLLSIHVVLLSSCLNPKFELLASNKIELLTTPTVKSVLVAGPESDSQCDSIYDEVITFDLTPIKKSYLAIYPAGGEVTIVLEGWNLEYYITRSKRAVE